MSRAARNHVLERRADALKLGDFLAYCVALRDGTHSNVSTISGRIDLEGKKLPDLAQREAELLRFSNEPDPVDERDRIPARPTPHWPMRLCDDAFALVKADGFNPHARSRGELANGEANCHQGVVAPVP